MPETVGIGIQDFEKLRRSNNFYIDKTLFIRDWWNSNDDVTLVTRPRRFGKTLTLSMVERFFSNRYDDQEELFGDLEIWKDEEMRALAGQFPVILLSFAGVKEEHYADAVRQICETISIVWRESIFLKQSETLTDAEKDTIDRYAREVTEKEAAIALKELCRLYRKHFSEKKVLLLLDEYDTPMQEVYVSGYWDELVNFTRNLFNAGFKTNPSLGRGLMTGITRVSRESMFSDLNNLKVVTTTSKKYATSFGFTETEVFDALETYGYTDDDRKGVKDWYDGFVFGGVADIYNPWSIINFLQEGKLAPYWSNTSSNSLAGKLIREGDPDLKIALEDLLAGKTVTATFDEEVSYGELSDNSESVFSLLMASGYLKPVATDGEQYTLALTNYEVQRAFERIVRGWFARQRTNYNDFIKALLLNDLDAMNISLSRVFTQTFSYFDTGKKSSEEETEKASERDIPERFYHGFVLGLIVDLQNRFIITSNRESGFGRYDVVMEPRDRAADDAYILEFKVRKEKKEADLEATVRAALQQIEDKQYAADLMARGITPDCIRKYGSAFHGKTVLIGEPDPSA